MFLKKISYIRLSSICNRNFINDIQSKKNGSSGTKRLVAEAAIRVFAPFS